MSTRDPWRGRILIGSGALALVALVAASALVGASKEADSSSPGARPVVASARWFGQMATPAEGRSPETEHECFQTPALGSPLVPAAELSVVSLSDGTVRIVGLLAERGHPEALWLLDAELADPIAPGERLELAVRLAEEELAAELGSRREETIDCRDWSYFGRIDGGLRGRGDREGALVRMSSTGGAAAQLGAGANGVDAGSGLRGRFFLEVIEQPIFGLPLSPISSRGGFRLDLAHETVGHALSPTDPFGAEGSPTGVLTLGDLGRFHFVAGGQFVEQHTGRAKLTGVLAGIDDPSATLAVDFTCSEPVTPGEDSFPFPVAPERRLERETYAEAVDPSSWHGYRELSGALTGFGSWRGARLDVSLLGPVFQVGLGANGVNRGYGASARIVADVVRQPAEGIHLPERIEAGELRFELGLGAAQYVDAAVVSDRSRRGDDGSIRLPGLGRDFVLAAGGDFSEQPDGTARLTGVIQRRDEPAYRFLVDVELSGRMNAGENGYPPEGSPWRDLEGAVYVERGGSIDANAWHYYLSAHGHLTGRGALAGARYSIERQGPAWQVGLAANGRNLDYGFSGRFSGVLRSQPDEGAVLPPTLTGGRFHLDLGGMRSQRVAGASGGSALELDELGGDFVFLSGGQLQQHADGTARLSGVVARAAFPSQRFALDLRLDHRLDPGAAGYPPPGSPKRSLSGAAYADAGGPIDPASWSYYRSLTGTLTGLESFAGGRLAVRDTGPAFQLGPGANNVGTGPGAAAWLRVEVLEQPDGAASFPATIERGRLHLWCGDPTSSTTHDHLTRY